MLYDSGIAVEMTAFHQLPAGDETATFIRGSDGAHAEWAMGLDATTRRSRRCAPSSRARTGCGRAA